MIYIIALLAVIICAGSMIGVFKTSQLVDMVRQVVITRPLRIAAIMARIIIGVVLIMVAAETRFPLTIVIIGGLVILSGIVLIFLNEEKIQSWLDRVLQQSLPVIRTILMVVSLFGLFLLYAVIQ